MFIPPMLLTPITEPFDSDQYVVEPKIDGHRAIISRIGPETRIWTRHRTECTPQYPELWNVPINGDVVLDGEIACVGEDGTFDFEAVMDRFRLRKRDRIRYAVNHSSVHFVAWDILFYGGYDLRKLPLTERKAILQSVLTPNKYFSQVLSVDGSQGVLLAEQTKKLGMEGVCFKLKDSIYKSGRHQDWLKKVHYQTAEVFITGYRKEKFGWLLREEIEGKLRPVGILEVGTTPAQRQAFHRMAREMTTSEDRQFVYLEPGIRARVKFPRRTRNGMLRTPSFVEFIS